MISQEKKKENSPLNDMELLPSKCVCDKAFLFFNLVYPFFLKKKKISLSKLADTQPDMWGINATCEKFECFHLLYTEKSESWYFITLLKPPMIYQKQF